MNTTNKKITHFDSEGNARMVDVGNKDITARVAVAQGQITMAQETLRLIQSGAHKKGDVLAVARIAGIMAAKKTAELVPLCHPIPITHVEIRLLLDENQNSVLCETTVETRDRTGVEMEALMATQVALLTIYDMCKKADRGMVIESVMLLEKDGGQSGAWKRSNE